MDYLERKYLWKVTYTDKTDGTRGVAAYFTNKNDAERYCREECRGSDPAVLQASLWVGQDDGLFYQVTAKQIPVDVSAHRRRALEKLTADEKLALGIT